MSDALPAKAQEVRVPTPTLLFYHGGRTALVGSAQDFWATDDTCGMECQ